MRTLTSTPARCRRFQSFEKQLPRGVVIENVGQEDDRRFGLSDRSQHRRIRLVPVDEGLHAVTGQKGPRGDVSDEVRELDGLVVRVEQARDVTRKQAVTGPAIVPVLFGLAPERDRATPDAVDADEVIKDGAE